MENNLIKNTDYYTNRRDDLISLVENFEFKSILEIGGGRFDTLKYLSKSKGRSGVGVDPASFSTQSEDNCRFYNSVFDRDFIDNNIDGEKFDLVIAGDVLEHILDTELFFQNVSAVLNEKGLVLISVPNIRQIRALFQIFIKGTFPRNETGLFDDTHLRWFCKSDLISYAERYSFSVVEHRYVGKYANRLIPNIVNEFLALQNIFLLKQR